MASYFCVYFRNSIMVMAIEKKYGKSRTVAVSVPGVWICNSGSNSERHHQHLYYYRGDIRNDRIIFITKRIQGKGIKDIF